MKQRWKDLNLCSGTSCDGMVRGRAADIDGRRKTRTVLTLDAVRRGIESMASVRGRKACSSSPSGFLDDPETDRRRVIAASREAQTAVYFVDVRGLQALSGGVGSAADAGVAGQRTGPYHHRLPGGASSSPRGRKPWPTTPAASR